MGRKPSYFSDTLPTTRGGTGNGDGYIRTGQKSGTTAGTKATIEGEDNEGSGKNGIICGSNNSASYDNCLVTGENNYAGVKNQIIGGKWNSPSGSALFQLGNGTGINARSNAFSVESDGRALKGNSNAFPAASNIAAVEQGMNASAGYPHSSSHDPGEYIYVIQTDQIYRVIGSSTIGTTTNYIVGTNVEEVNIGDVLTQLNSDIASLDTGYKYTTWNLVAYRKFVNGLVYFRATCAGNTPSWTSLGTLDTGFRPTVNMTFTNGSATVNVINDGSVEFKSTASAQSYVAGVFAV